MIQVSLDVSAVPTDPAGAGRYTIELATALAARDDIGLHLVCRKGDAPRWEALHPEGVVAAAPNRRPARLAWEQLRLPRLLADLPVAAHHAPHYTMPERSRLPAVVTIHDLTFFDHPEWHERTKVPLFRRAIRVAARHASALICVSNATADRLVAICSPAAPVHVIPHGVDHARFRPAGPDDAGDDLTTLQALGVRPPYLAFVGTIEPRKDVTALVRAFDRLASAHEELRLVLAGGAGWGAGELDKTLAETKAAGRILRLGYVEDAVVPVLLRQAAAVAYPSLEEGFGLPALEALACGAPLVTTTGSAMEEVAAGAALLVAPGDVDALAGAIDMLVRGDAGLAERRRRGLAIAGRHTWASSAAEHAGAYRSVL